MFYLARYTCDKLKLVQFFHSFSGQTRLDMNQENINCQTLLKAGHSKSGTYILKDISEEKPRLAFCQMEDGGIETEIQGLHITLRV